MGSLQNACMFPSLQTLENIWNTNLQTYSYQMLTMYEGNNRVTFECVVGYF